MKKARPAILLTLLLLLLTSNLPAQDTAPLLRHVVTITFKQDAPADSVKALDEVYISLSKHVAVKDFEWGINVSPRDTAVKHVYITSFATKEDMDSYKQQPLYANLFKKSVAVSEAVVSRLVTRGSGGLSLLSDELLQAVKHTRPARKAVHLFIEDVFSHRKISKPSKYG